jgi:urease accessory protein
MAIITTDLALLRVLQLSSAALPVGGYAFSQGMETATEEGWLPDAGAVTDWLCLQLQLGQTRVDLPLLARSLAAAHAGNTESLKLWNDYTLACRETAELRLTDAAMGDALARLLRHLRGFAMASAHYSLGPRMALNGYVWAWLENQVAAATKLVPLGQSAAQAILNKLVQRIPSALDRALELTDEQIGASLPGLTMVSCWHENQYCRLFRS